MIRGRSFCLFLVVVVVVVVVVFAVVAEAIFQVIRKQHETARSEFERNQTAQPNLLLHCSPYKNP